MPTFLLFLGGRRVGKMTGADEKKVNYCVMRAYAHDAHFRKGWGFPGRGFEGGFCKTSARCRRFEKKTSARCRRFEKKTSARCRRFEKKHPQDVDVLKKKHPQDVYFSENVRKMRTFQKTYTRCGLFRKRTQDVYFSKMGCISKTADRRAKRTPFSPPF